MVELLLKEDDPDPVGGDASAGNAAGVDLSCSGQRAAAAYQASGSLGSVTRKAPRLPSTFRQSKTESRARASRTSSSLRGMSSSESSAAVTWRRIQPSSGASRGIPDRATRVGVTFGHRKPQPMANRGQRWRVTIAPPLAESEAESAEIAANPCASASFQALVPETEAISGGGSSPDSGLAPLIPTRPHAGHSQQKRLMGFEPTTFCMASAEPNSEFGFNMRNLPIRAAGDWAETGPFRRGLGSGTGSLPNDPPPPSRRESRPAPSNHNRPARSADLD